VTATLNLSEEEIVPTGIGASDAYRRLLARLSHQSVVKHFDAYGDIDWEGEDFAIDGSDARFELGDDDPLGATEWYQSLGQEERARIGLDIVAAKMKMGLQFESILKRGLLEFASTLPNGSPEFRYAYHEVIEEAQHSLMFQEFVNRSGLDARGLKKIDMWQTRRIIALGRQFPPLFFAFVLGGEDPIDHVQRKALRSGQELHPLLERIMRIHVTEEARHLSFARQYLKNTVVDLGPVRRAILGIGAPLILSGMAQLMMQPRSQVVRIHGIPPRVISEAYRKNPAHKAETRESLRKVRQLWQELGLLGPGYRAVWRALGLIESKSATAHAAPESM
jgi:P-aminobenzoate N-oxygenase AurF